MIVVDSSALIAILEEEPEAGRFLTTIREASRCLVSAVTVYETGIVIRARRGRESAAEIMLFLEELGAEIVPFAEPYISLSLEAYDRYGKGINPTTRLNLGDCVAYVLAKSANAPLLFKGADFTGTDVLQCA